MNVMWSRFIRSAYRKEPISSFVLLVGVAEAVNGGFHSSWSLVTFGFGTMGVAIALRWWKLQHRPIEPVERVPVRYLPSRSSRPQLPAINTISKQHPPT